MFRNRSAVGWGSHFRYVTEERGILSAAIIAEWQRRPVMPVGEEYLIKSLQRIYDEVDDIIEEERYELSRSVS